MLLAKFFVRVPSQSAADVRHYLEEHATGSYQLVDVRQPKEYSAGHLPGAQLIPLKELPQRLAELDPDLPTIVYCASGRRSTAATKLLLGAGFKEVYNMEGGIKAWHGATAAGPAELGLELLPSDLDLNDAICLAWAMEEGLQRFYRLLEDEAADQTEKTLFHKLASFENVHKKRLLDRYQAIHGPDSRPPDEQAVVMEGGRRIGDYLKRAKALLHAPADIFDLAMSLEAQALDLYARMAAASDDAASREFFHQMADEEKDHLSFLANELDRFLA